MKTWHGESAYPNHKASFEVPFFRCVKSVYLCLRLTPVLLIVLELCFCAISQMLPKLQNIQFSTGKEVHFEWSMCKECTTHNTEGQRSVTAGQSRWGLPLLLRHTQTEGHSNECFAARNVRGWACGNSHVLSSYLYCDGIGNTTMQKVLTFEMSHCPFTFFVSFNS